MFNKGKETNKKLLNIRSNPSNVGLHNESNRISWLEKTLKKIPNGSRILDAGAGEQPFKKFCTHLNYVSQDFAQYDPKSLPIGLQMSRWDYGTLDIISDIVSIPEPDSSFDAIMCTEVFEHILNPSEAIKEFSRLLRNDGFLIITAPFCSLTHFAPFHFYTGFNRYFYEKELVRNNFKIIEISANGNFFEYIAQELRRIEYVAKEHNCGQLTLKEKIAIELVLNKLEEFSLKDKGSDALLNFGLHVLAAKNGHSTT